MARTQERSVVWHATAPGKPMQSGLVESVKGRLRDACLNEQVCACLAEARALIEAWRIDYKRVRRDGRLARVPLALYVARVDTPARQQPDDSAYTAGAITAPSGANEKRTLHPGG